MDLNDLINFDITKYIFWIVLAIVLIVGLYIFKCIDNYRKSNRVNKMAKEIKEINKKLDKLLDKEGIK